MVRFLDTRLGDPVPTGRSEGWRSDFGLAAACCLTLFTASCSETPEEPPPPTFTATDSAGVRVVVNSAPQWGEGEGWQVTPDPVLTLGTVDYPPEQQFQRLGEVTRLGDGTVVVLEIEDAQLRAFDPSGDLLWTAGGIGDGPGETRRYDDTRAVLTRLPGDTLQVQNGLERIRFSSGGDLVAHDKVDFQRFLRLGDFHLLYCPFNRYFLSNAILICKEDELPVPRPGSWSAEPMIMRTTWDLDQLDTLGVFLETNYWADRRLPVGIRSPLGPHGLFRVGGGEQAKLLFARNDEYRIEIWDIGTADLSMVVKRQAPLRARTDDEATYLVRTGHLGLLVQALPDLAGSASNPSDSRWAALDSVSNAEDFLLDELGFLWVRRGPSPLEGDEGLLQNITTPDGKQWTIPRPSGLHDVFRPDGVYLGTVQLPHDLEVEEIGADYVLGKTTDDLDVEYVRVYGLDRGAAPFR